MAFKVVQDHVFLVLPGHRNAIISLKHVNDFFTTSAIRMNVEEACIRVTNPNPSQPRAVTALNLEASSPWQCLSEH